LSASLSKLRVVTGIVLPTFRLPRPALRKLHILFEPDEIEGEDYIDPPLHSSRMLEGLSGE
jgi:hypothetical protein